MVLVNFLGVSAKHDTQERVCFLGERARGLHDFQKDLSKVPSFKYYIKKFFSIFLE